MTRSLRNLFLILHLAPTLLIAQSRVLSPPFDPATYKSLDAGERWHRWVQEDGGSWSIHENAFMIIPFAQAFNTPHEWGRTIGGFGRRTGTEYAGAVMENSIHDGFSAFLGTDPRYFPCACKGLFRRGGHAIEMTFLTYTRSGSKTPDLPQITGRYGSSMITALWYPPNYHPLVKGIQLGHIQMGLVGVLHEVQEFSPELKHFFHVGNRATATQNP